MTQPHRPVGPGDHVFLIDGSSFVFRAYYPVDPAGSEIQLPHRTACRPARSGCSRPRCCSSSATGPAGIKPTHLAMIFDKTENSFRRDIYPAYKAHRKDPPDELVPQFPLMRATVSAFGMVPIEQEPLRGRRHHRHLCAPGARGRRRRAHRLGRQGPDAARRAGRVDVRPGFGPGRRRRLARGAALRPGRGRRIFRRRRRTRWSTSRRSPAIRPTTCRARPASASRPPRSSSPNTAISKRCSRAPARSSSRSAARALTNPETVKLHPHLEAARHPGSRRAGRDAARRARDA